MTFIASDRRVLGTCVQEFRVILIVALRVREDGRQRVNQKKMCDPNAHALCFLTSDL